MSPHWTENLEPRRRWLKLSGRNICSAAIFAAIFGASLVAYNRLHHHELVSMEAEGKAYFVIGCLVFVSPLAAIGSLVGRWWVGALLGFLVFCAFAMYVLIAISIVGI